MPDPAKLRQKRRLRRQFAALEKGVPQLRRPIRAILHDRWALWRLPVAILFICGGLLAFLPVLGLWMIPFGLLLLAVDVAPLRGPVSTFMIRLRRRFGPWLRRRKGE